MPRLDILPFEQLQTICEYVAGPQPSNLYALSEVNQRLLAASTVVLHRKICFFIPTSKSLQRQIVKFRSLLDSRSSWKHVRELRVQGDMKLEAEKEPTTEEEPATEERDRSLQDERRMEAHIRAELGDFASPKSQWFGWRPENRIQDAYHEIWQPLANMVTDMPGLKDLFFEYSLLPACLLQVLHQRHIRLHMTDLRLQSLLKDEEYLYDDENYIDDADYFANFDPYMKELHPHERELLTSSSLYELSIKSHRLQYDDADWLMGEDDAHFGIAMQLVAGAAPSLQVLRVWSSIGKRTVTSIPLINALGQDPAPVRSSSPRDPKKLKSLTELELGREECFLELDDVAVWDKYVDFSTLRVLKLESFTDDEVLRWAANNCSFAALKTLVLTLSRNGIDPYRLRTHSSDELQPCLHTNDFILSLPPLQKLKITGGVLNSKFRACFERHSPSLKSLWVGHTEKCRDRDTAYDLETIKVILEHPAPYLEDLTLPVKRSQGDIHELAIYRAELLGRCPDYRIYI